MIGKITTAILLSWGLSQIIKILIEGRKSFNWNIFFRSGGMPSSHTAIVTALTTAVFILEGASLTFFTALVFSSIVIIDARGVRLESEKQAIMLNKIGKLTGRNALSEHIGHKTSEVIGGIILGIVITIIVFAL